MKTRIVALLVVITLIALTGISFPPAPAAAEVAAIRLQYIVAADQLISLFDIPSIQQNVLKNYGKRYKMELMRAQGTPFIVAGMAAGEVDVAALAYNSFASAILKGVVPGGLTVISTDFYDSHPEYFNMPWAALADSPITSVRDLRGKKIGVLALGTGADATQRLMLKKSGLDPSKDVNIVEIPLPAMEEALRSRKIDVGMFAPFFYFRAMTRGGGLKKVFDSYQAWGKPYLFSFNVARNDFLKKNPDAIRGFLEDYIALSRYAYKPENRETVIDSVAAQFKLPKPVLQQYYLTRNDYYRPLDGRVSAEELQYPISKIHELGFLERDVEVARYIDNSYLPR